MRKKNKEKLQGENKNPEVRQHPNTQTLRTRPNTAAHPNLLPLRTGPPNKKERRTK